MPKIRSDLEHAAGMLISAIQKEWSAELGTPSSTESERVMYAAHKLLQEAKLRGQIKAILGAGNVTAFLGGAWVAAHPDVLQHIRLLEDAEQFRNG